MAVKLEGQGPDWPLLKVLLQAAIVPGVMESGKVAGTVLNVTVTEANVVARLLATGVPQPVTGSQPVPALYPLLFPEVMSWKSTEYNAGLFAVWYNKGSIFPKATPFLSCRTIARKPDHKGVERLVPEQPNQPASGDILAVPHLSDSVE